VNHQHLRPEDIDRLIDDETGPDARALRSRLDECAECRARLAAQEQVVALLEELPRHAPSHRFADRVMAEVPVFVPWYVTAGETLRRYTPVGRRARLLAFGLAATAGSLLTMAIVWAASRPDLVLLGIEVAESRTRSLLASASAGLAGPLFGTQVGAATSGAGTLGLVILGLVILAATVGTFWGLRAIAAAAVRRRT